MKSAAASVVQNFPEDAGFVAANDSSDARGRWIGVEKPVITTTSARAPKRAQERGDINVRANAVADHGNVRQPRDQLSPSNFPIPISQVIRMKTRRWLGYPL